MILKPRASATHNYVDVYIFSMPGGGKTGFIVRTYWEKDNERGGPVIFDLDHGGADATCADMGLAGKIPIIPINTEEELIYSCTYYKEIIKEVNATKGFEDYKCQIFSWDTVSSMEDTIMGEPKRPQGPVLPASPGFGLMSKSRARDDAFAPALADYKGMVNRTKAFMRHVRALPIHTIVTAHAVRELTDDSKKGMSVREEDKTYGIFPDLIGKNRYNSHKLHDIFMYMEQRGNKFFGYTTPRGGAASRTRFQSHLQPVIENPDFWEFVKINDKLRAT
jgi:hypothetical protein